jgi:bis(5'-nucleosyl)-tetraphosphatase (symmetrical)
VQTGANDARSSVVRWVVGDVQGCARELEDLLAAVRFDPTHDELVCAGDLINRGPDSLATLRLWAGVGGRGVLGNHDIYALCARSGRWPRKHDQLQALYDAPDADDLLARVRELPALLHLAKPSDSKGRDAWVVHGGLHPAWSDLHAVASRLEALRHDDDWLESDPVRFATSVRCCTVDGKRSKWDGAPQGCPPPYRPWDAFYEGDALVVHGHWARRGHYRGPRTLGLDSGCVYGGPLTAWCQEEDRIVAVPCREPAGYPC